MIRETSFYLTVPGISLYAFIVISLYYIPVQNAYHHTLTSETLVFYLLLSAIFYPLSLILITFGNKGLQFFNLKWVYWLSTLPFLIAGVLIVLYR